MEDAQPFRPEALLEQRSFLRALAQSLLSDEHGAEDVAQDACIAALEKPPRSGEALSAWLARVTRNLALNRVRERERRAWREEQAARRDPAPSEEEVDARLHAQRRVVEAVLSLREPYKSAIWMRFYEHLPPREIARRTGVPVETVKSRIKRGLSELKTALDREFGDRSTWCSALLPLAFGKATVAGSPALVLSAALLLALAVGGVGLALASDDAPLRSDAWRGHAVAIDGRAASGVRGLGDTAELYRDRRPIAEVVTGPQERAHGTVRGRALDARTGAPLGLLHVCCTGADGSVQRAETDANGVYAFANVSDPRASRIELFDADDAVPLEIVERRSTLGDGDDDHAREDELCLAIGPTYTLAFDPPVQIVAADFFASLALGDAPEREADVQLGAVRDGPAPWVRFARSPRTSLLGTAGRSTYSLHVESRDGLWRGEARVIAIAAAIGKPVRLVLEPCARAGGRILATDGSAIAGARVELESSRGDIVRTARSDATGQWTIGAIAPGSWRLSVRSPLHVAAEESLELAPLDARTLDVRLASRATSELAGELRSRTGAHVPRGALRLRSLSDADLVLETTASPDGSGPARRDVFRFEAVPPGEYELLPPMEDTFAWDPPSITLTVPGRAPRFTCRDDVPLIDVSLRAADADTGRPIERFRAAILLDRQAAGRRRATALEPGPRRIEARAGEATFTGIPRGMEGWWLVESDGHASAWGRLDELRGSGARRQGEARLERAWTCRLWIGALGEDGQATGLCGARILTSNGKLLAASLSDGDALLDLLYDPGRISIDLPGWRVTSIEGFSRGKLRTPMDVHRVWMEPSR